MEHKTHYRKVFKSDHLGVADLEEFIEDGKQLNFTIKLVKQEYEVVVAGRKGNYNIAYFEENIKPLVLNSINSKRVKGFNKNSPFVEDWGNTRVTLYIDNNVKLMGDVVGGVRISPTQPQPQKQKPVLEPKLKEIWERAIKYLSDGGDMNKVTEGYSISEIDLDKLKEEVKSDTTPDKAE